MDMFERFSNFELFSDKNLGSIRTMEDETGKRWFVGQDIGKCLGLGSGLQDAYSNLIDRKMVEEEYEKAEEEKREPKITIKDIERVRVSVKVLNVDSNDFQTKTGRGGARSVALVSESGMYNIIINSRSPLKNDFQRWITNEVLPSIRETGGYIYDQGKLNEKDLTTIKAVETDLADRVSSLIRENNDLEKENTTLHEKNEILESKNSYLKVRRHDLRQDVDRLKEVKRDLKNDVRHLRNEVSIRNRDLSDYEDIIERQARDYARLYKEVKELRGEIPPEPEKPQNEPVFYIDPASGLRFSSMEEIYSDDGLLEKNGEKEDSPSNAIDNEAEEEYEL